jgi:hypothetical protein
MSFVSTWPGWPGDFGASAVSFLSLTTIQRVSIPGANISLRVSRSQHGPLREGSRLDGEARYWGRVAEPGLHCLGVDAQDNEDRGRDRTQIAEPQRRGLPADKLAPTDC